MSVSNQAAEAFSPELRRLLLTVVLGALAPTLDTTIVTIAQQTLVTELGAPIGTVQWVVSVYFLAYVAVIPTVGWLDRRLGGRRLWIGALTLFGVASVLCGTAWDPLSLIAFRFVQGLAGGCLVTLLQVLPMRSAGGRGGSLGWVCSTTGWKHFRVERAVCNARTCAFDDCYG